MRNVFDQYGQPENRLTHALVCTLDGDRSLLTPFLRWAGCEGVPPPSQLRITEQQVPGEALSGDEGDEGEGSGLPDACVFTDDGWSMLIEAKVQAGISPGQLRRHIATARRHEFHNPYLLLLSVDFPPKRLPSRATHRSWREVYAWFRKRAESSEWARTFTDYMEILESRMIADDYSIRGTLTMFDGLRFDTENPYTYREGKRLIRLLGDDLQKRKDLRAIGVDPMGERRSAITGRRGVGVWDYLPLRVARGSKNFTDYPHLTMGLRQNEAGAAITIPNGVRGGFRTKLKNVGEEGFIDVLLDVEERLRPVLRRSKDSKAVLYAMQRHYTSQRSAGKLDARAEADLRTIVPGKRREAKYQPQWIGSIYDVMTQKRSNIQLGVDVHFSYDCPVSRSAKAVDLFAKAWIAMSPLIDFVLED
jgi:hypothetical protein